MTAPPAKANSGRQKPSDVRDPSERGPRRPVSESPPRVMSVSARAANEAIGSDTPMTVTNDRPDERVFVTPRVIDQNAFDELSGTLRRLIDQAEHAGKDLEVCVEKVGEAKRDQTKSTEQLQERLRLSARMLKAFQSQIARTESAIAELTSQEEKSHAIEQRVDEAVNSAQQRIDAAVDAALERLEQRLHERIASALQEMDREIEERAEPARRVMEEIEAITPAAERLTEIAEQAECTVASMSHRVATLAVDLAERTDTVEPLIARTEAAAMQLDEQVQQTEQYVDALAERGKQVTERIESACEQSAVAGDELSKQIESAQFASRELAIDVEACEALETLLEQLKPWEAFVLDQDERHATDANALPEPAARLVEELRQRLDQDLAEFSSVLAHVAEQFRAFSSRDHVRKEAGERDGRCGTNAEQMSGGGKGVVSVIRPTSPLPFSSHAKLSQAE